MRRTLLAIAICAIVVVPSRAQEGLWDPGHGEQCRFDSDSYTAGDVRRFRDDWERLVATAARSDDEWAGVYHQNNETSYRKLVWAPGAGYAYFFVSTCRAGFNDVDYGSVRRTPGLVTFSTEREGVSSYPRGLPSRLVPVEWGAWRCLVPETSFREFCRYAVGRDLHETRYSSSEPAFYINSDASDQPGWGTGVPVVPPEYARFVVSPLRARVIEVGATFVRQQCDASDEEVIPVTLDIGWKEGAEVGNLFRLAGSDSDDTVLVVEVRDGESRGEIVRWPFERDAPLTIGKGAELATAGPFENMRDE